MILLQILSSKKVIVSAGLVLILSVFLTLFPLIGTLGFEYSIIIAFFISFISIFISAEYINLDLRNKYPNRKRYSDLISTSIFINFIILLVPFLVGLCSSLLKSDCYIKEGIVFFLIITTVTVFFASSLGLLVGYLFPRRGFFLGSVCVLSIIVYSLYVLYSEPPVFSYNHIFGLFPGPLYDQIILIDQKIFIFRAVTICWGIFFLLLLKLLHDRKFNYTGVGTIILFIVAGTILATYKAYENDLGIKHTRKYIQNTVFKDYYETEHFKIYFPLNSKVSENIELIVLDHEWRYAELAEFLNVKPKKKITSYIYPDEKTRKRVIGAGRTTIANPIHSEIHIVYDFYPHPVLKHELVHVLSAEFGSGFLKISPKIGFVEGLAVAADWDNSDGYDPHQWSAAMLAANKGLDINDILGFGFWRASASKSYTLMGSFVRYLIDRYGVDKFKVAYNTGSFEIYGKDINHIITDWKDSLSELKIGKVVLALSDYKYSKPSIFDDSCPRISSYLAEEGLAEFDGGNYNASTEAFTQALKYNPRSGSLREFLAYSYYYEKDFNRLIKLIDNKISATSNITHNIILNLVGNYHWTRADSSKAVQIFNELYNEPLPIDIENELSIKLDSADKQHAEQDGIKQYYMTKDTLRRVSILENMTRKYPDYAVPYYLLGKMYFSDWQFDLAQQYLEQSEALGMPSAKLKLENSRLLGISLYANGRYELAQKKFIDIYRVTRRGKFGSIAAEFIKRSEWSNIYLLSL